MKRLTLSMIILSIVLSLSAQEGDSILMERVNMLKKEISLLKKKNKSLQAQIYALQKGHKKDKVLVDEKLAANEEEIVQSKAAIGGLEASIAESEENTREGLTLLGDWTRKILMILGILVIIGFIIILILVITSRSSFRKDLIKMEARVDNIRDAQDQKLKEALKKHDEDMETLKKEIEKGKK